MGWDCWMMRHRQENDKAFQEEEGGRCDDELSGDKRKRDEADDGEEVRAEINTTQDYSCGEMDYTKHFVAPQDFPSRDAVVTWAKETATRLGFFLVIASNKTQRDGRINCYLRCDRHETRTIRNYDNAVRLNTKRKGTGCKFVIKATERRNRSGWYIACCRGDSGKHNHELLNHAKAQNNGLSPGAKQLVRELTEAEFKPSIILAAVKEKFPEDNASPRLIYNFRIQHRAMSVAGKDFQREGTDNTNVEQQHQPLRNNKKENNPATVAESTYDNEELSNKWKNDKKRLRIYEADDGRELGAETEEEQNGGTDGNDEYKTLEGDKDEKISKMKKLNIGTEIMNDESTFKLPNFEPVINANKSIGFSNMTQYYSCDGINYVRHFVVVEDFLSRDAAVTWAKETAARLGFFLVIASNKQRRDGRKDCYLRCDRFVPKTTRNLDNAVRLNTKRKGVGCKFLVKVVERKNRSGWYITFGSADNCKHNHEVDESTKSQNRSLSLGAKQLVRELTEAEMKPSDILAAVKEKFPEDNPSPKHIYNFRIHLRKAIPKSQNLSHVAL